jgi:hypothetical protein
MHREVLVIMAHEWSTQRKIGTPARSFASDQRIPLRCNRRSFPKANVSLTSAFVGPARLEPATDGL